MQDSDLLETQLLNGPCGHAALFIITWCSTKEVLESFFCQTDSGGAIGDLRDSSFVINRLTGFSHRRTIGADHRHHTLRDQALCGQ